MQILPNDTAINFAGIYGALNSDTRSSMMFMEAMDDALEAVADGDNHSATSALEDPTTGPLVESPYTRHSSNGVTYTLSEVCFTKQELQELRAALVKEGAPEESLAKFDILAGQPDGATMAQVMASLIGGNSGTQISEDDEHAITALLGQIDPSGQLAGNALDLMRQGNGAGALDLIQNALAGLGSAESIDVDMAGILALGRGLGLNRDGLRNLAAGFGGRDSLTVNADQFDTLMNPAKNYFMEQAARDGKLEAALEKTLKPIISKARDRMEKEKAASELQDRRVEQSRILIDKTVQERSRKIMDDTVVGDGELTAKLQKEAVEQAANIQKDLPDAQPRDMDMQGQIHDFLQGQPMGGKFAQAEGKNQPDGSGLMDQHKDNKSDGWQNLLGKVQVKQAQPQAATNSFVYSMLQGQPQQMEGMAPLQNNSPAMPAQLANQVEQGMLKAMKDGSTRLDLQLSPTDLGNISITLIARNGEVTAQLRSEKSETAEILSRQLETMRVNLEQQGIKVDKIEVQLENRQDDLAQNSFQDLNQHNARQEEDARRQTLNRLRNLASIWNNNENSGGSVLEQSMHTIGQTARYAGQALHVVA